MNPLDPNGILQPKKGMTSVEAATLWLEDNDRRVREQAATFDLDALGRSSIARQMGFDFDLTIHHNRFVITDKSTGLKTTAFYSEPMDQKAIKRLVRALGRLKRLHDERVRGY